MTFLTNIQHLPVRLGIITIGVALFIFDLLAPHGYAISFLYAIIILLTYWFERRGMHWVAVICIALTILGFIFSPEGELSYDIFNRSLSVITFLAISALSTREVREENLRRQLAAIVEFSSEAIFDAATNGQILSWNKGASQIFGYEPEEIIGHSIDVLIDVEHKPDVEAILTSITGNRRFERYEMTGVQKDGAKITLSLSMSPIRSLGNDRASISIVARDITALKQAEAQLLKFNEMLEEQVHERTMEIERANRELADFSYTIGHDLRAPLRAINSFAKIILEDEKLRTPEFDRLSQSPAGQDMAAAATHASMPLLTSEERHRHLETISRSALTMGKLIDAFLGYSRLVRRGYRFDVVDMNAVVANAIKSAARRFPSSGNRELTIGSLPVAWGDREALYTVMYEYLCNAFQFSQGQACAKIEVGSFTEDTGRDITYYVKDNGIGFSMEYKNKLFGVFERLHPIDHGIPIFSQTGIGLATVKKIIEAHHGHVWGEGVEGKGATFYFRLPTDS